MLHKGNASLGQGRAEEAEYFYKNILISTPKHPDANHNLGLITLSKNETKKALSLFKNALDINPNVEQFWLSYIEALIKDHQIEKVEHLFNSNKKIAVSEEKILILKSKLNYVKGNIINTPTKSQLEKLLYYYQNEQYENAKNLSSLLIKDFPNHPFSWKILGAILAQTGQEKEALKIIQKTVELAPQDAKAHNNLGNILKSTGSLLEAEKCYRRAISLEP